MALLDKFRKKRKKQTPEKKETEKKAALEQNKGLKKSKELTKAEISGKNPAWVYKIIKEPLISEKASFLAEKSKYIFRVSPKANKTEVKKAVQLLYGVTVKKVHMIWAAAKKRRVGRHQGWRKGLKKGFKKAIISLKQGEKIEIQ